MKRNRFIWLGLLVVVVLASFLLVQATEQRLAPDNNVATVQSADAADGTCRAVVRALILNQRSEPNTDAAIVAQAARGEVFTPVAIDDTGLWLRVEISAGSVWISRQYVTLHGDCAPFGTAISESIGSASGGDDLNSTTNLALSPVFTDEVQYWRAYINLWADEYGIDANLIATVIQIESCGDPTVGSSAGAQGLFQVMPFHFEPEEDMLDVQTNARRGLDYLAGALALAQGDVRLALAGYNGGYGIMYRDWVAETRAYVSWGSRIYADASTGATTSAALADWLAAGGANLCRRARQSIGAF
ncbi:MAG: transglycosylase SLT domain-containing protein [Chloroflexota bacterium]|nr:transglycosylase SLT domain-containing protein [Chloroflexota bacterium]